MNAFLNALTGRKSLRDYQHASRTFRDGNFRLLPKQKFLFYVVFNLSPTAAAVVKDETKREISMLVKSVDLPTYTFDVQTFNQYNRHKHVQTKLNFNPINIRLHDDMADITRNMWYAYMDYYYTDQRYDNYATYRYKDTYGPRVARVFGYEAANREPFFDDIKIYSIYDKKFTEYSLINPILTNFNHDSHDHSQSDLLENQMTVTFELVKYATGFVGGIGSPTGFGELHYDKEPSPLSPSGGGTSSVFGVGGIFDATNSITEDLANGKFGSAAIQGLRTFQNFQNIDVKQFVTSEITQGVKKALKGENPFAFPGSGSSGANKLKYNPLPRTNTLGGSATVYNEQGGAVTGSGQVITGGPAGMSFSINGTSGSLVPTENGGKFTVTKPDGTTETITAGITSEGQNTRVQVGHNMSTADKTVLAASAGMVLTGGNWKAAALAGAATYFIDTATKGGVTNQDNLPDGGVGVNATNSASKASGVSTSSGGTQIERIPPGFVPWDGTIKNNLETGEKDQLKNVGGKTYVKRAGTYIPEAGE